MYSEGDMQHTWSVDPSLFTGLVEKRLSDRVVDVTTQVFNGVVQKSPVLSGAFRSVWTVAEGSPNFVERTDRPKAVLSAPSMPSIKPVGRYPVLYVANGQPYGKLLEDGSSAKAPLGMVKVTIANIR